MSARSSKASLSPDICLQVQLSESRRELQELKASLRVAQKEKELLIAEKQVRDTEKTTVMNSKY